MHIYNTAMHILIYCRKSTYCCNIIYLLQTLCPHYVDMSHIYVSAHNLFIADIMPTLCRYVTCKCLRYKTTLSATYPLQCLFNMSLQQCLRYQQTLSAKCINVSASKRHCPLKATMSLQTFVL